MGRNIAVVTFLLSLTACDLRPHDGEIQSPPPVTAVLLTPAQATVRAGHAVQFAAAPRGDGRVPQRVTWKLRCVSGCSWYPYNPGSSRRAASSWRPSTTRARWWWR